MTYDSSGVVCINLHRLASVGIVLGDWGGDGLIMPDDDVVCSRPQSNLKIRLIRGGDPRA